jgi:hypothetical protein
MGFLDEAEIRQALDIAKNDLNEAISILTSEKLDHTTSSTNTYNYSNTNTAPHALDMDLTDEQQQQQQPFDHTKFPYECLLTLEANVFADSWSISYKKNEWLERLLISSLHLTRTNEFRSNDDLDNYNRFVSRGLSECFRKLLDSAAVNKWNEEIKHGV